MQDVKALKRKVEVSFPDLSPEDMDLLFPSKAMLSPKSRRFPVHDVSQRCTLRHVHMHDMVACGVPPSDLGLRERS